MRINNRKIINYLIKPMKKIKNKNKIEKLKDKKIER